VLTQNSQQHLLTFALGGRVRGISLGEKVSELLRPPATALAYPLQQREEPLEVCEIPTHCVVDSEIDGSSAANRGKIEQCPLDSRHRDAAHDCDVIRRQRC
jgi:hypothetical protein